MAFDDSSPHLTEPAATELVLAAISTRKEGAAVVVLATAAAVGRSLAGLADGSAALAIVAGLQGRGGGSRRTLGGRGLCRG